MPICPTCHALCDEGLLLCPADGGKLDADPMIGTVLGDRYRILKAVGAGGMGTVYFCEHVVLGKKMAVKVLRPEYSRDEELVRRFEQEAVAASRIGQENIVDVIDFGRTPEGSLYFAMEALEGESLGTILRRDGALAVPRALPILSQICRALGAAHAQGIVHRDLKPDNVIVSRRDDGSEFVKVLDFGISKMGTVRENGRITRAGMIIGTPEYMAPEQAAAADVDHRADIYAFGVVAYEMVTGVIPFHGPTALATLMMHKAEQPVPPSHRKAGIPREVEVLILHTLDKRPEGRPQSMAEVGMELGPALARYGLSPVYTPTRPAFPAPPLPSAPAAQAGAASPAGTVVYHSGRLSRGRGGTVQLDAEELESGERPLAKPGKKLGRWSVALLALAVAGGAGTAAWWRFARRVPAPVETAPKGTAAAQPNLPDFGIIPDVPQAFDQVPDTAENPVPDITAGAPASPKSAGQPPAGGAAPPSLPREQRVTLRTVPAGAEVYRGDEYLGVTPLQVTIPQGQAIEYRFQVPGEPPVIRRVRGGARSMEVRLQRVPVPEPLGSRTKTEENPPPKAEPALKPDPF